MRIDALSSYGFLFILIIFCHHIGVFPGGGVLGVTLFFILGGIKMNLGYSEKVTNKDFDYGLYLKRRLIKFYPVHWLTLLTTVLISLPTFFGFDWIIRFLANASLMQSWIPVGRYYYSFNGVSWYLVNTIFFTVVFPIFYPFFKKNGRSFCIAYLFVYIFLVFFLPKTLYQPILYINPIIRFGEFTLGIALGEIIKKISNGSLKYRFNCKIDWLKQHMFVLLLIEFSLLILLIIQGYVLGEKEIGMLSIIYWLPASLFFLVLCLRAKVAKIWVFSSLFRWFSPLTFCFYMSHTLCIKFFNPILKDLGLGNFFRGFVLLFVSLLVSLLIHYCFEKPINKLSNKKS